MHACDLSKRTRTCIEMDIQAKHFPWGVPPGGRGDGACVLTQPTYVNIYSNTLKIPLLVGGTVQRFVSGAVEIG